MRVCLSFLLVILVAPATAQEAEPSEPPRMEEGLSLLEEGTRLLLEGLIDEFGPALEQLRGMVEGLDAYYPPEMLPNGDIIIRRKTPDEALPEGETEI